MADEGPGCGGCGCVLCGIMLSLTVVAAVGLLCFAFIKWLWSVLA